MPDNFPNPVHPGLPLPFVVLDAEGRVLATFANRRDAEAWKDADAKAVSVLTDTQPDPDTEIDPR